MANFTSFFKSLLLKAAADAAAPNLSNSTGTIGDSSIATSADVLLHPTGIVIDGGGSTITTGVKGFMEVPFNATIVGWTLLSSDASATSGAIKIDVWKDVGANYPPDNSDSITNGHEPEITASGNRATDSDLSDWTSVTVTAGDILGFNVDSCTSIVKATLILKLRKT